MFYEKGEIHFLSEVTTGTSQRGTQWQNMTVVLTVETSSTSFKYLALKVSGDRVDDVLQFQRGDKVEVGYAVSSREWEGKWFSNIDLISIKALSESAPAPAPRQPKARTARPPQAQRPAQRRPAPAPQQNSPEELDPQNYDDLPADFYNW